MNKNKQKAVISGITCFFLLAVSNVKVEAKSISANANLNYSVSERKSGATSSTTTSLSEIYSLHFIKVPTDTINLSGDVRVIRMKSDSNESSTFSPSLYATMNNEYFNARTGYQVNENNPALGNKTTNTTKNASFSTSPANYPSLALNYHETEAKDNLTVHKANTKNTGLNGSTSYSFMGVSMRLNHNRNESMNFVDQSKQESRSSSGSIDYSRSFFNNKVGTSINYGLSGTDYIRTSLTGIPIFFDEEKEIFSGLYDIDLIPADGQLPDNCSQCLALIDDNKASETGIDLNDNNRNIGLKLKSKDKIRKLYLYITSEETEIPSIDFKWLVYYSDDNTPGTAWTVISKSVSYDESNSRFEFELSSPIEALFFKVVNMDHDPLAQKINITEIEAIGTTAEEVTTKDEQSQERQFVGVNLRFSPTDKLRMSYNGNFDESKQSPQNNKNNNFSHGLALSYTVSNKFSVASNAQYRRSNTEGQETTGSNSYSLSLYSNPVETINGSASAGHNESLEGESVISQTDSLNLNTFLNIYTGISLGTGFAVAKSKNLKTKSDTTSNSFSANLQLLPRRSITITVAGSLSQASTTQEGGTIDSESETLRSSISYNPSRYLNLAADFQFAPKTSRNYSLNTSLPGDLQIRLSYSLADSGAETIGANVYWNISQYISISSSYSITEAHNETGDRSKRYGITLSIRR